MSFRLFVYYSALCGGWSALLGWVLGRFLAPDVEIWKDGVRGLLLGTMIALGLGLLDGVWNLSVKRSGEIAMRVSVAVLVGCVGGFVGGLAGGLLYLATESPAFFVLGWTLTGLLVGVSLPCFELLTSLGQQQNVRGARSKLMKCLIGGTAGGLIGGVLALLLRMVLVGIFSGTTKSVDWLWSPTAWGFVALGTCIGLLVGLTQVILKEAWIKVEAGFRPGREMILSKEKTSIGRAEGCDIAMFGDMTCEKRHANILLVGNNYYVEDSGSEGGTFVNDRLVSGRVGLKSGDVIRIGKSVLRFNEKQSRKKTAAVTSA